MDSIYNLILRLPCRVGKSKLMDDVSLSEIERLNHELLVTRNTLKQKEKDIELLRKVIVEHKRKHWLVRQSRHRWRNAFEGFCESIVMEISNVGSGKDIMGEISGIVDGFKCVYERNRDMDVSQKEECFNVRDAG